MIPENEIEPRENAGTPAASQPCSLSGRRFSPALAWNMSARASAGAKVLKSTDVTRLPFAEKSVACPP